MRKSDVEEAMKLLRKALELNPNHVRSLVSLAEILTEEVHVKRHPFPPPQLLGLSEQTCVNWSLFTCSN